MMREHSDIETYNYSRFVGAADFHAFRSVLPVGTKPPNFTATRLATGDRVQLINFWREKDLLVEFGSLT